MSDAVTAHVAYALAWLTFAVGHSALAHAPLRLWAKRRLGAWYRLSYNVISIVHLGAVWMLGNWLFRDVSTAVLPAAATTGLLVVYLAGWAVLLVGLRGYDLGRFCGLTQIRSRAGADPAGDDEPLRTDGLHRYVRHPLYAGGLLILWGQAWGPMGIATAVWGSLYLVIGARFEEQRLLRLIGPDYAAYRARVPAFVPWKGRAL